jgi:hypothetical protein
MIAKNNQSLLDISIQAFGTLESLMSIAFNNDVSVTDELTVNDELLLSDFNNGETEIMAFYKKNNLTPATALTDADFAIIEIENCNLCNCFK